MNAPTALPRPHATLYPLVPRPGPRPGFSSALGLVPWFFEPPNPTALNQMDKLPTFTQARSSLIPNLKNPNPNPNPNLNSNPNDLTTSTQSVTNTTFTHRAPRPARGQRRHLQSRFCVRSKVTLTLLNPNPSPNPSGEASVVFATAEKLLANGALLQAATELTLPLPPTLNVLTPTLK